MNDVVERVARAICEDEYTRRELVRPWWGDRGEQPPGTIRVSPFEKQMYRDNARAAIEAMREPSPEMIDAGDDCYSLARGTESWTIAGCKGSEQIWSAMLSAALADASPDIGKEG